MPPELGLKKGKDAVLSRADCLCPICREIFLEPVTLPCDHTLCKPCFLETVAKANICCPLCRKRVSSWARQHARNKTLVNVELWKRVQDTFPTQCERRLAGQEDDDASAPVPSHVVSQPGEVRREYEEQINQIAEEKRALEEAERKASEEYIQRLLAEEQERLAQERRRQEEIQLEEDETLARVISQELNAGPISESQRNAGPGNVTPAKRKQKRPGGDIHKFLFPLPQRCPNGAMSPSFSANKENVPHSSQSTEGTVSTPELHDGPTAHRPVPEASAPPEVFLTPEPSPPGSSPARDVSSAKRSSSLVEDGGLTGDASAKRPCLAPPPPEPGPTLGEEPILQELAWREAELFRRWQQEEEDRQLALRLQEELHREEEAARAVDRRKGSGDEYLLRPKGKTPSRRQSLPSSQQKKERVGRRSDHAPREGRNNQKGQKQTTLTDMFASVGERSP